MLLHNYCHRRGFPVTRCVESDEVDAAEGVAKAHLQSGHKLNIENPRGAGYRYDLEHSVTRDDICGRLQASPLRDKLAALVEAYGVERPQHSSHP